MTPKKSLKQYRGKMRIFQKIVGAPNISRLYHWNKDKNEYVPPLRGKSYCARRYGNLGGKKKREHAFFTTLEEARAWQHQNLIIECNPLDKVSNIECSPTIASVIERWKKEAWQLLKENTKIQYEKCLKFYDSILNCPIESIKPADIDLLIFSWKTYQYKKIRTSFTKELETLKIIFGWYQNNFDESKLVPPFKSRHHKYIILKHASKVTRKHMTDEESSRFLEALKEEGEIFYALGFIQFKQMLRISEVAAMKWKNLDANEQSYNLTEHVVWPRVNNREHYIALGTKNVKAGESYTINLFRDVVEQLLSLKRHPGCDLVFHDNGKLLTYRQIQYRYDKAFKAAGLPFSSTHVLRHSGSTSFYNATGDLLALQQMGTWSDSRMPQHYAKVMSSRAKDAISKLEGKPTLKLVKSNS